jgi:RNA polymerase sigma-70 factor (ECF subfamily)
MSARRIIKLCNSLAIGIGWQCTEDFAGNRAILWKGEHLVFLADTKLPATHNLAHPRQGLSVPELTYTESLQEEPQGDVTQLLAQWGQGDRAALDAATRIVYSELRKIAESYLQQERAEHTLQPTALINEAYLRLVKEEYPSFENRKKFFAFSARLMRQVLVDHARSASAEKRGGSVAKVPLNEAMDFVPDRAHEFLALNEALESLARLSPRKAQVIELRYFGGLNVEETAQVLDVSIATISREQRMAEAWLSEAMTEAPGS